MRFAGRDLLEVLALESVRAEAIVVGEDLGTVEPGFRDDARRTRRAVDAASCGSRTSPRRPTPPRRSAWSTTHDLPTLAGEWSGADAAELAALVDPRRRTPPTTSGAASRRSSDASADTDEEAVAVEVHRRLGRSPAALVLATLEDVTGVLHRPNVPGTTTERPNWSVALPGRGRRTCGRASPPVLRARRPVERPEPRRRARSGI